MKGLTDLSQILAIITHDNLTTTTLNIVDCVAKGELIPTEGELLPKAIQMFSKLEK